MILRLLSVDPQYCYTNYMAWSKIKISNRDFIMCYVPRFNPEANRPYDQIIKRQLGKLVKELKQYHIFRIEIKIDKEEYTSF